MNKDLLDYKKINIHINSLVAWGFCSLMGSQRKGRQYVAENEAARLRN